MTKKLGVIMYFIGIVFYLLVIVVATITVENLSVMVDIISLLIIIGTNVAILIGTKSIKDFIYGIKVILFKDFQSEKNSISDSISIFQLLWKVTLGSGIIGFISGIIVMLKTLDDPSNIGPSMALSLITVLYSIIIAVGIYLPAIYILNKTKRKLLEG